MWTFEFESPVGKRYLRRYFSGVMVSFDSPDRFEKNLWWSYEHRKWLPYSEMGKEGGSSHMDGIKTFKAFKRWLKKNLYLSELDVHFTFVNRIPNSNIYAKWVAK